MSRWLKVVVASLAIGVSSAQAADMPVKASQFLSPVRAANWTGFYVALQAGYAWGEVDPFLASNGTIPVTMKPEGAFIAAQIGYDYQLTPNWVLGIRAMLPLEASLNQTVRDPTFTAETLSMKTNWFFAITPYVGWAIGPWLPYVGVGLAVGEATGTQVVPVAAFTATDTKTHTGFNVIAGLRYRIAQNWWAGMQYDFIRLNAETYNIGIVPGTVGVIPHLGFEAHAISWILAYKW
jgi:outer membrane immunogenic protein